MTPPKKRLMQVYEMRNGSVYWLSRIRIFIVCIGGQWYPVRDEATIKELRDELDPILK